MLFDFPSPYVSIMTGSVTTAAAMANVLYDIGATQGWPVQIAVGAGMGYAANHLARVSTTPTGTANSVMLNDTAHGFAYQGIAGLTVPVKLIPGLAITLDYRYFATLRKTFGGIVKSGAATAPISRRYNNSNQTVLIGLRYSL